MIYSEQQPISYDLTPEYENDWNGINGGATINPTFEKIGGEPIASGGFGCVFKPALSCNNKPDFRPKDKISKLMTEKYAEREYQEIIRFQKILSSIPNYTHYFLLNDFTLCKPAPLTNSDLKNFDKCRALKKTGITEKNINQSLDKILSLTMPDGGIAVDDFIRQITKYNELIKLNDLLVPLLVKGIIPMNHKHIYHSDIKDSNVLVKVQTYTSYLKKPLYTRLIDWGISVEYKPGDKFPSMWTNRPFQFNTPFSMVLFSDLFNEKYAEFIKSNPTFDKETIGSFVLDYIYLWNKKRGPGHYKTINNMFYILFSDDLKNIPSQDVEKMIETNYTLVYIKNYLTEIIYHFSNKKGLFNIESYIHKVFIKIIDIWGFVSIYFCILEELFEFKNTLTENEKQLFESLKNIILTYLYNPRIKPISIQSLTKDLKNLNHYFNEEIKMNNESSHFLINKSYSIKKSSISKKKRFQSMMMVTTSNNQNKNKNSKIIKSNKNMKSMKNSHLVKNFSNSKSNSIINNNINNNYNSNRRMIKTRKNKLGLLNHMII